MEFSPMHKFAVFLLIVYLLVLSVEGRLLKSVSKNDSKQSSHAQQADSLEGYKEDFRPTTPGSSPGAGHSFAEDDEDIVQQKPGSINGKHSFARDEEDFRPTAPGKSPGAGHSFQEDDEDIVEQKPGSISMQGNGKHSIERAKEDVRPTNPGHSPGVRRVYQSKNSEPNA